MDFIVFLTYRKYIGLWFDPIFYVINEDLIIRNLNYIRNPGR